MLTIRAPILRVPGLAKNLPRICFYGARAASNSVGGAPKKATSNATSAAKNPPMATPTNRQPKDVNARWWYKRYDQLEEKWYRRSLEQSRELNREILGQSSEITKLRVGCSSPSF